MLARASVCAGSAGLASLRMTTQRLSSSCYGDFYIGKRICVWSGICSVASGLIIKHALGRRMLAKASVCVGAAGLASLHMTTQRLSSSCYGLNMTTETRLSFTYKKAHEAKPVRFYFKITESIKTGDGGPRAYQPKGPIEAHSLMAREP
jgi:hypothetical protein